MKLSLLRRGVWATIVAAALTAACPLAAPGANAASAAPRLHVSGNRLLDSSGNQVVLHGMNRSGAEFACVQGNGIFDGPTDQASISAMKSWGAVVDAVRVPLNEACWNGESYVNSAYAGTNYINAIKTYVNLLNANGIVAILDLHWTDGQYTGPSAGCSSAQATCQKPMPDAAQAIPFWTSVASTFKGNDAVVFDLFNEPYASRADNNNSSEGWQCWATGSPCTGISYQVAGMQQMVNAVRSTGADNVLMLGGEEYSNDLTGWLQHEPTDPDHNLVASWHSYNNNTCNSQSCWNSQVAPVIAQVPVVAGEIGEGDCAGGYIDALASWLESQHTGFLAWTWNAWSGCGPILITDYNGTPTAFGAAYKAILASLDGASTGGSGCGATYQLVNSWAGGFQAQVTVTNDGSSPTNGWTVTWTFPGDQRITQLWNGSYAQSGPSVTVNSQSYNGAIAAGGTTTFGFTGTYTANDAAPRGLACTTH